MANIGDCKSPITGSNPVGTSKYLNMKFLTIVNTATLLLSIWNLIITCQTYNSISELEDRIYSCERADPTLFNCDTTYANFSPPAPDTTPPSKPKWSYSADGETWHEYKEGDSNLKMVSISDTFYFSSKISRSFGPWNPDSIPMYKHYYKIGK